MAGRHGSLSLAARQLFSPGDCRNFKKFASLDLIVAPASSTQDREVAHLPREAHPICSSYR